MSTEFLQILWFVLIAFLWIMFFFLEGFDFGVGMLLPFFSKKDEDRRAVINTIGPHWDANEVWLITAGGATFAAFPNWYATLFSGFYLALFVILLGLILRGVAFEFRSKDAHPRWRNLWDWCIFIGSFLPPLLFGVAFANMVKGVPIDENMMYTGQLAHPAKSLWIVERTGFRSDFPIAWRKLSQPEVGKRTGRSRPQLRRQAGLAGVSDDIRLYDFHLCVHRCVHPPRHCLHHRSTRECNRRCTVQKLYGTKKRRLGFRFGCDNHHLNFGHLFHDLVPTSDGLQYQPSLQFNNLQRIIHALHPFGNDHRGLNFCTNSAGLPNMVVPDFPSTGQS